MRSLEWLRRFPRPPIIGAVTWMLYQMVDVGEQFVVTRFSVMAPDNLRARRITTQAVILRKALYVVITIFAVASALMLFDQVRSLGTSVLASAGVVGIIIGFAAQRTMANLFAGFQRRSVSRYDWTTW